MIWFAVFVIAALVILVTLSLRAESENAEAYAATQSAVDALDARYSELGF